MPTTNPVPSQDPSDLLFNAGKLDEVLNGAVNSFTDRLGVARRTVAGMNADFDAQLADAESDLNVYRADAAASAAQALGYLNTIRTTSYGAYASDPATDPLGNPPTVGDEYFNTTSNLLKRFNGTTWQASDINTANFAASSGSSLVGYQPAGIGAVSTDVENKLQEISVSPEDFGAVGDGQSFDTVAINKMVAHMVLTGVRHAKGNRKYRVFGLDLTSLPSGSVVDFSSAIIYATPTAGTPAIKLGGVSHRVSFGDVLSYVNPTGSVVTDGVAILLESGFYSKFTVGKVLGFKSPVECRPTRGFNGSNGYAWNTLHAKFLAAGTGDCFYAKANEGGGGANTAYITESDWIIERMDGGRGFIMDANPTQIGNSAFRNNGNRYKLGFESLTGDALVQVATNRCSLLAARFEQVGGNYLTEDSLCGRNRYSVGFAIRSDKLSLPGTLYTIDSQMLDSNGGTTSLARFGLSSSGSAFGFADSYATAMSGSLTFQDSYSRYMDDRWQIKRLDGTRRRIRLHSDNEFEFYASGSPDFTLNKSTRAVSVSVTTPTTITMPVEREFNGESFFLIVRSLGSTLKIQKSSGSVQTKADSSAVGTNLVGTGTYLVVYNNDVWTPVQISSQTL